MQLEPVDIQAAELQCRRRGRPPGKGNKVKKKVTVEKTEVSGLQSSVSQNIMANDSSGNDECADDVNTSVILPKTETTLKPERAEVKKEEVVDSLNVEFEKEKDLIDPVSDNDCDNHESRSALEELDPWQPAESSSDNEFSPNKDDSPSKIGRVDIKATRLSSPCNSPFEDYQFEDIADESLDPAAFLSNTEVKEEVQTDSRTVVDDEEIIKADLIKKEGECEVEKKNERNGEELLSNKKRRRALMTDEEMEVTKEREKIRMRKRRAGRNAEEMEADKQRAREVMRKLEDNDYDVKTDPSFIFDKKTFFKNGASPKPKRRKVSGDVHVCSETGCGYQSPKAALVRRHERQVHGEVVRYDCAHCDVKGISLDGIKRHFNKNHGILPWVKEEHPVSQVVSKLSLRTKGQRKQDFAKQQKYDCTHCDDAKSLMYFKIRKHIRLVHGEDVPRDLASLKTSDGGLQHYRDGDEYVCSTCEHRCSKFDTLVRHIHRHHRVKNCHKCEYETSSIAGLREHVNTEHGGQLNPCSLCDKGMLSVQGLKKHMRTQHGEPKVLQCKHCMFKICGSDLMKKHMKEEHGVSDQSSEGLYCHICPKSSHSREGLNRHLRIAHKLLSPTGPDGKNVQCDQCGYTTEKKYKLREHIRIKHEIGGEKFYCDQCNFSSKYKSSVFNHTRIKHGGEGGTPAESLKCEYCGKQTTSKLYLKDHINTDHLGIFYECDLCPWTGKSAQLLSWHKTGRHGSGFPCDQCDYVATQPTSLKTHKRVKHGSGYPCNWPSCGYQATQPQILRQHKQAVHDKVRHGSVVL